MSNIILRDIEPVLMERIQRVAQAHGWNLHTALMRLLEQGLYSCEGDLARSLDDTDAQALQAAIAALESVPSDPGFAMIGRIDDGASGTAAPDRPVPTPSIPDSLFGDEVPEPGGSR